PLADPPADPAAASRVKFPLPNPSKIGVERYTKLLHEFIKQGGHEGWKHDPQTRPTGPFFVHDDGEVESLGTHSPAAVKVYYSPEVWKWMTGDRKAPIPDGGMIVKVLYARDEKDPTTFSPDPTGFSVMVKDSQGSWDGWFYSDGGPLQKPTHEHAASFFDPNAGFALSCVNCHASTDNPEGTYASVRNVTGKPIEFLTQVSPQGLKKGLKKGSDIHQPAAHLKTQRNADNLKASPHWPIPKEKLRAPAPMPFWSEDHVPQGPKPDGHRTLLTASTCMACHDATQLHSALPNMAFTSVNEKGEKVHANLSPFGEWRYSMMGLSGRDPVFYAQLESERALHPELSAEIDNKCMSCHTAMGQRQFEADKGKGALFTHDKAFARSDHADAKYGALARDGISCATCHQMQPEGLGSPATYGGKYELPAKSKEVFGPYEKVVTLPMEQAMGITPKYGAHMSDSGMCASCHTVPVPVLDVGRKYTPEEFAKLSAGTGRDVFHEQTTYLEWKNSSYSTESGPNATARSCQDCHMPRTYDGKQLKFKIANIEDDTFPIVDHRAPDDKLRMEVREKYSRHSLNGINVFVLEMFRQQPWLLGVSRRDALFPGENVVPGFDTAINSAVQMAREQTAKLEILKAERRNGKLLATVAVTNLSGHKFPSGVQFRRAWIHFKVDSGQRTLFESGATDEWGVIGRAVNGKFTPLPSEFFEKNSWQPHYEKITSDEQVQIYEQLVKDSKGRFTTSFLSLKEVVKDNRLLPRGWKSDGPDAELTAPRGEVKTDADFNDGLGRDIVTYEVPIDVEMTTPIRVSATLYYQSLPPYYLKQRFVHADKPETQRLYYLYSSLDLENTPIKNWKLEIARATKELR
ncbi:MAG TPA: cytochrome P460 family protein, partial [Planctomycetota bacterium]|nr:cytochrome P460 family protein [Planctomycetota bacterium]